MYYYIDKNNNLVISDAIFDVDITSLLKGSKIDDDLYLISKDGKRYDLNDADVIAEIPLDGIVVEGETSLNTSALTGEAKPKDVKVRDITLNL